MKRASSRDWCGTPRVIDVVRDANQHLRLSAYEWLVGDIRNVGTSLVIDDHWCTSGMYFRNLWQEVSDWLIQIATREICVVIEIDWVCLMFVAENRYGFGSQAGESCHHSRMYVHGAQCQIQLRELEGSYNIVVSDTRLKLLIRELIKRRRKRVLFFLDYWWITLWIISGISYMTNRVRVGVVPDAPHVAKALYSTASQEMK